MVQPIMDFDEVGTMRTGDHRGGRHQKYVLDDRGRRLLLDLYDGSTANTTKLEHLLSVPRRVVKRWARELGVGRQKAPDWTPEEILYLQTNIRRKGLDEMAKHLGRTTTSIRIKARRLSLSFVNTDGYTMSDMRLALGNDAKTIQKWMEKGWLQGRRQGKNSHNWRFTNKNIRDFVIAHPNEIDNRRIDWLWMVDLLVGGNNYGLGSLLNEHVKSEEAEQS